MGQGQSTGFPGGGPPDKKEVRVKERGEVERGRRCAPPRAFNGVERREGAPFFLLLALGEEGPCAPRSGEA